MDKPRSLSVKDYLIRMMAVKLMLPENVLDAVVSHQFSSANTALFTNDSVEISGFGKFFYNHKKAIRKMEKERMKEAYYVNALTDPTLSDTKRQSYTNKLNNTRNQIEQLKPKLNNHEAVRDLRGLEEQSDSPLPFEADDTGYVGTEDCNLPGVFPSFEIPQDQQA